MKKLKWGMIGGGAGSQIGPAHRLGASLDGLFEFTAGALDHIPAESIRYGQSFGLGQRAYPSWQEMLAGEQAHADPIDLVTIATPNSTHCEITKAFLEGGFHVLCEKPMTMTVEEGEEIVQISKTTEKICAVNYGYSGYSLVRHMKAMVARGDGYILNTASAAGLLTQVGSAPYAVTKHAAVSFAEWLSVTYGDRGLKVSVLCPQAVRTAMTADNPDGVASVDGMMEPEVLCDSVVETLRNEQFLVLPHPEVLTYMQRKSGDYDRWIKGMRRLQEGYGNFDWP